MTRVDSDRTDRLPLATIRAASEDGSLTATLTLLKGPNVGTVYALESGITLVGRSEDATIQIVADGISRRHAQIVREGERYILSDLGSTNGTICRGTLLDEPMELQDGDRVNLGGRVILRFALEGALEEALRLHVYTMATRDALTGAYNRRYFEERLNSEWAWAIRHNNTCALLMVDVDHFKAINDNHGHPTGDAVLQQIVNQLWRDLRQEDLVARLGGEEFAILCRATGIDAACLLADRLRERISITPFTHGRTSLGVTVSVGVAVSDSNEVSSPSALMERADERLYEAKRGGRNRVVPARNGETDSSPQ